MGIKVSLIDCHESTVCTSPMELPYEILICSEKFQAHCTYLRHNRH